MLIDNFITLNPDSAHLRAAFQSEFDRLDAIVSFLEAGMSGVYTIGDARAVLHDITIVAPVLEQQIAGHPASNYFYFRMYRLQSILFDKICCTDLRYSSAAYTMWRNRIVADEVEDRVLLRSEILDLLKMSFVEQNPGFNYVFFCLRHVLSEGLYPEFDYEVIDARAFDDCAIDALLDLPRYPLMYWYHWEDHTSYRAVANTREELNILLLRAGIEPNPGFVVVDFCLCVLYYEDLQPWSEYEVCETHTFDDSAIEALYAMRDYPITFVYMDLNHTKYRVSALTREELNTLLLRAGIEPNPGWKGSEQERKRLNARAFNFDATDPRTWKFNESDAVVFVRSVKDHVFVKEHSLDYVVSKLLMRRGVPVHSAFRMVCERYGVPILSRRTDTSSSMSLPSNDHVPLSTIPDVNSVTAAKIALGDALNCKDRRALARVTKQSKFLNFGVGDTIRDGADSVQLGLSMAGQSVRSGFEQLGASVSASTTQLGADIDRAAEKLRRIDVVHSFDIKARDIPNVLSDAYLRTIPKPVQDFVSLVVDCLPMIVSDDPLVALAVQPALMSRYGFLTAAIADAFVLFAKKLMKWTTQTITKQNLGSPGPIDEHVASTLYTVAYGLIFGSMPEGSGGSLVKRVQYLNAVATLAKNGVSFGRVLIDMFKYVVNWIYECVYGVPYYDKEQSELLLESAKLDAQVTSIINKEEVTPEDVEELSRLRAKIVTHSVKLNTVAGLEKEAARMKKLEDSIGSFQGFEALPAENTRGRMPTGILRLSGLGGRGKTLVYDFITAALWSRRHWPGSKPGKCVVQWRYGHNFQDKITPDSRVMIFDDPFNVQNQDWVASVIADLYELGNPRAKKREGAALLDKDSMFEHFEIAIVGDNGARADIPNNNDFALARRFSLGMFDVEVKSRYRKSNGTLDAAKVESINLDDVWEFSPWTRSDIKLNFWQLISHIESVLSESHMIFQKTHANVLSIAEIARSKELPAAIALPTPTSMFKKQARYTPNSKLEEITSFSSKDLSAIAASFTQDRDLLEIHPDDLAAVLLGETSANGRTAAQVLFDYSTALKRISKTKPKKAWREPETYVIHGECAFDEGRCLEHKVCPSRLEPPAPHNEWRIYSVLAKLGKVPSWMGNVYGNARKLGLFLTTDPLLCSVLEYLKSAAALVAVASLIAPVFTFFSGRSPVPQAYSTTYARNPARSAQKLGFDVTKQFHVSSLRPDKDDWLVSKLSTNTVPISIPLRDRPGVMNANAFCVESNIHYCVKHVFVDEPIAGKVAFFGDVATTYPVAFVEWLGWDVVHPIDDSKPCVWVLPVPGLDLVFIVTPRSGMIRCDLSKFIARESTGLNQLVDMQIVLRASHVNELDDVTYAVKSSKFLPATARSMGDVIDLAPYAIEESPIGLFCRSPEPTPDGACGSPWFTRNTHVAGGVQRIAAIHGAYQDSASVAIGVPIWFELHARLRSMLPSRSKNVSASARNDFPVNGGELAASVVATSTLTKKQAAVQNLKNDITRSPAFDLLVGLEVFDAATKETVIIPPPPRVPVDLRNPVRALQKMPLSPVIMSEKVHEDYVEAAKYVRMKYIAPLDQKFRDRLYVPTRLQVINGDPVVDVPPIDVTTSDGYNPDHKLGLPGKQPHLYKRPDGLWDIRPEYEEDYQVIKEELIAGIVPTCIVVDNGKVELRPVGKVPRNTSAYQTLVLIAVKEVLYWLPVAVKYGRIKNGTLYGVDLNSSEGAAVLTNLRNKSHKNEGDYSNFDATIQPDQSCVVDEEVFLPMMQLIAECGGPKYSPATFLAALRTQTLVLHVFGEIVYVRWFGNTSGGFITTPKNCAIGSTNQAYCWLKFHRATNRGGDVWTDYEQNDVTFVYGDDFSGSNNQKEYDNFHISDTVAELGQRVTPSTKGADFQAHASRSTILRRTPWVDGSLTKWRLELEVLAEIHAFVRDHSITRISATRVNMEAALREWYYVSEDAFVKVASRFNSWLAEQGGAPILLTYSDLKRAHREKYNDYSPFGSTLRNAGSVVKQGAFSALARARPLSADDVPHRPVEVRETRRPSLAEQVRFLAILILSVLVLTDFYKRTAATGNQTPNNVSTSITDAGAPRANENPIIERDALTAFHDDTVVVSATPSQIVAAPARDTDPYPDQGMKEVLSRPYRIADLSWPAATVPGTLIGTYKFPDVLFTIPNIQDKLKSFRYLRTGAKIAFRVNSNGFAGGTLLIGWIPFYDPDAAGAWRHKFNALSQTGAYLLSASRADTLEIDIPWFPPFQYKDLRSTANPGMLGTVFVYVLNQLVFSNSGAPNSLSVSVFANFVDPKVAGPDINGAPLLPAVRKQSSEAIMKSAKGLIAGVPSAIKTVVGTVTSFADLGKVLSFLDKPTSVQTGITSLHPTRGMANAAGLDDSDKLSLDPLASVSVDDAIFAGSRARPPWKDVLGIPALIAITTFTQAAAADTLITSWPVRPNYARKVGSSPGVYYPGALAYYSMFYRYWRGSIEYGIHFVCPSNVTARVRISFLPNVAATTAPPENQGGDIFSKVVSITGDTFVKFPIEYLADTYLKTCQDLSVLDTTDADAIGRVTITVLNEVVSVNSAAVTPIAVNVWMAAGPNFKFSMPDDWPNGWAPNFVTGESTPMAKIRKQSSIRAMFAKATDGLVPTRLLEERGVVSPEDFTGIIDLLKRFTISDGVTAGEAWLPEPEVGNLQWLLLLPFIGWRGGLRYKFFAETPAWSRADFLWQSADGIGGYYNTGATFVYRDITPVLEAEVPYYDQYAWRETYPIMTVNDRPAVMFETDSSDNWDVFTAVADDFSLGPFMGPPPINPPSPMEVKSSISLRAPISTSSDEVAG